MTDKTDAPTKKPSGPFATVLRTSAIFSLLLITGCASVETARDSLGKNDISSISGYVTEFPEVSVNQIAGSTPEDVFKIGDTAEIDVYGVDSLSNTYVIDRNGNISFPLIGTIQVANMSTVELQQALTQRYGERYLQSPSINVKIDAKDLGRFVVDGAVNKPGVFDINRIVKLTEAIALAQGLSEDTNGSKVFIIRSIAGERKILQADMRAIRKIGANDPQIIPNDVVFIEDSAGRVAFREFLQTVPLLNTAILFSR